jgi:hypothetical protein
MNDPLRTEIAASTRLIVVKVGTRVLTGSDGLLDTARIESLGRQFDAILSQGRQVVLVSSGAVGAGMGRMGLTQRPQELAHLQAVAAIGQSCLIEAYERAFRAQGRHAAQVLLVPHDFVDRRQYLHARQTLVRLMELGCVPIVNENDAIAADGRMDRAHVRSLAFSQPAARLQLEAILHPMIGAEAQRQAAAAAGGVVVFDNSLYFGEVVNDSTDPDVIAIKAVNDHVAADTRVDTVLLNVGDGLLMARKR